MDEKRMIAGCRRGDPAARKELYEQYAPVMMGVCMRYVNNRETARDLLQDGFIKVFTKIHTYSGAGAFGGWLRRVFVTTALEYLRAAHASQSDLDLAGCENYSDEVNETVLDRLSADELLACIARLPAGYRTVFNLYAIEGYTHREIARMLHIEEVTSRSQFIRARKALQKSVESLMERIDATQDTK